MQRQAHITSSLLLPSVATQTAVFLSIQPPCVAASAATTAFAVTIRLNPDGGFSFFRMNLACLWCQPQTISQTITASLNPDGGFSLFRKREKKSAEKREKGLCTAKAATPSALKKDQQEPKSSVWRGKAASYFAYRCKEITSYCRHAALHQLHRGIQKHSVRFRNRSLLFHAFPQGLVLN